MAKAKTTESVHSSQSTNRLNDTRQPFLARGRSIVERLPGAIDGVRGTIDAASGQLDHLSDVDARSAFEFSAGVTIGLFLAGAPRLILGVALIPVAILGRAKIERGARPTIKAER